MASESPSSTSTNLLLRLRSEDEDAWPLLLEIYGPLVYGWARGAKLQADDARDVAQEVFRAVHVKLAQFRRDRPGDSFRGWLWTITRNKVRDHFRQLSDRPRAAGGTEAQIKLLDLPDEPAEPSSSDGRREIRSVHLRALEQVKSQFESKTWEAFWRATIEEEPVAEIAASMGTSVWAVYKARSRVLQRLRGELGELLD